ncbi:unnamed protein product [Angiostrongylus costaricensis]|uniref:HTH_48 domain-containing protein n=1 Tax=Angiostrongylus costaricensis TaxID=334426 RepID=A0A158PF95_ANGCS|nr:unnamed protein product [Angiostrongylus costaricensis]
MVVIIVFSVTSSKKNGAVTDVITELSTTPNTATHPFASSYPFPTAHKAFEEFSNRATFKDITRDSKHLGFEKDSGVSLLPTSNDVNWTISSNQSTAFPLNDNFDKQSRAIVRHFVKIIGAPKGFKSKVTSVKWEKYGSTSTSYTLSTSRTIETSTLSSTTTVKFPTTPTLVPVVQTTMPAASFGMEQRSFNSDAMSQHTVSFGEPFTSNSTAPSRIKLLPVLGASSISTAAAGPLNFLATTASSSNSLFEGDAILLNSTNNSSEKSVSKIISSPFTSFATSSTIQKSLDTSLRSSSQSLVDLSISPSFFGPNTQALISMKNTENVRPKLLKSENDKELLTHDEKQFSKEDLFPGNKLQGKPSLVKSVLSSPRYLQMTSTAPVLVPEIHTQHLNFLNFNERSLVSKVTIGPNTGADEATNNSETFTSSINITRQSATPNSQGSHQATKRLWIKWVANTPKTLRWTPKLGYLKKREPEPETTRGPFRVKFSHLGRKMFKIKDGGLKSGRHYSVLKLTGRHALLMSLAKTSLADQFPSTTTVSTTISRSDSSANLIPKQATQSIIVGTRLRHPHPYLNKTASVNSDTPPSSIPIVWLPVVYHTSQKEALPGRKGFNFIMNKSDIRVVFFHEWRSGHNAAAGARNIIKLEVNVVGESTVRTCFRQYRSGDFDLEVKEGRVRPNGLDDDELKLLMEANREVGTLAVDKRKWRLSRLSSKQAKQPRDSHSIVKVYGKTSDNKIRSSYQDQKVRNTELIREGMDTIEVPEVINTTQLDMDELEQALMEIASISSDSSILFCPELLLSDSSTAKYHVAYRMGEPVTALKGWRLLFSAKPMTSYLILLAWMIMSSVKDSDASTVTDSKFATPADDFGKHINSMEKHVRRHAQVRRSKRRDFDEKPTDRLSGNEDLPKQSITGSMKSQISHHCVIVECNFEKGNLCGFESGLHLLPLYNYSYKAIPVAYFTTKLWTNWKGSFDRSYRRIDRAPVFSANNQRFTATLLREKEMSTLSHKVHDIDLNLSYNLMLTRAQREGFFRKRDSKCI